MIKRNITHAILKLAKKYPAIGIVGPRQSGKTTLVQNIFPDKPYALLEDPDTREFAQKDPRGFLGQYPDGLIIDEIQRVPELFSYLQGIIDRESKPGRFILTGSQHFLMMENISQSLAGRIALFKLLPFSLPELFPDKISKDNYEPLMFKGFYPRIHDIKLNPTEWYSNYIQTYIERDIRQLKNVHNLSVFHTFLKMCASRTGSLLNLSSIGNDCGISYNTVKGWLSILEASFIIYLLPPHYKNFNKRLVKMPKLYFYDTGLVNYLLGIRTIEQLSTHALKGSIFESLIISELIKYQYSKGVEPEFYFWRDKTGHEIDCLFSKKGNLFPLEIKSGKTISDDFYNHLKYWNKLSGNSPKQSIIIYGGEQEQNRYSIKTISWQDYRQWQALLDE